MRFVIFLLPLFALFFGACSSKQYFEPSDVEGKVDTTGFLPSYLKVAQRDGATLDNGQFIDKDGVSTFKLKDEHRYINKSAKYVISSSPCGELALYDQSGKEERVLYFEREVISANEQNDYLALLFANNEIALFDLRSDGFLFRQVEQEATANDIRVAAPKFLDELVIYPTLDGKMVIVDMKSAEPLRIIAVSSEKFFNNVIFLDIVDNRLIAATQRRIVSVSPEFINNIETDIRDVIFVGDRVYIFSKQGEIILADSDLRERKRLKFPFAHFDAVIYGNFIYVIESQGYIIAVDKELLTSFTYELSSSISGPVFAARDRVYYRDYYFELSK